MIIITATLISVNIINKKIYTASQKILRNREDQ